MKGIQNIGQEPFSGVWKLRKQWKITVRTRVESLGQSNLRGADYKKGGRAVTPMTNFCYHNCDSLG